MSVRNVLGLILGGGVGTRLFPLTKMQAKPAVPLGGKYRLIDIPISNCLNSGISKIQLLTQYNSASLHQHIHETYKFDAFSGGFVQILAAARMGEREPTDSWYQGTADAVRKQLLEILTIRPSEVLILSGDHLYQMDYTEFVELHRERDADVTIAVQPVTAENAVRFGILQTDERGRIVAFKEKPETPEERAGLESGDDPDKPYLASMGIYVFKPEVLETLLREHDEKDFGRHIIPISMNTYRVYAYSFSGYWEDIGTIRSFFEANLALARPDPPFNLHDPTWPIYTRPRYLPNSRIEDCELDNALIADGCIIQKASISEAVIGPRSTIGQGTCLERVVVMGADSYEIDAQKIANRNAGIPDIGIGINCHISEAIIDANARIGKNVMINRHSPDEPDVEMDTHSLRGGVVVIPQGAVILDNTVI
ncbi:MAG: glucose-1-phosphate adenylyltransferase [Anaerolineae bacterium]|jgi:glucose-1-phosphate adenylyltransferase